jgi:hypothetical protein
MAFYCIYCGTGLPSDAKICFKCGKSLIGNSTSKTDSPKIEYTQVYLDWSRKTEIKYGAGNDEQQAEATAMRRIEEDLVPYFGEGWVIDGSFDSAVKVEIKPLGSHSVLYVGASVKLCRDCEGC